MLGGHAVVDAARRLLSACPDRRFERLAGRDIIGEHTVDWTTAPEDGTDEPVTHMAYGWATQVVVLDDDGRLHRVVAAQDVGRAINPRIVEGQVLGGIHMAWATPSPKHSTLLEAIRSPRPSRSWASCSPRQCPKSRRS